MCPAPGASGLRRLLIFATRRKINPLLWALLAQSLLVLATLWILVFRAPPQEVLFLPVQAPAASALPLPRQSLLADSARSAHAAALSHLAEYAAPLPAVADTHAPAHADFATAMATFSPLANASFGEAFSAATADASGIAQALGEHLSATQPVSFFGIEEQAERYVILLDTSNSMFVRSRGGTRHTYDFSEVKEETCRLLQSFNANTLFNLIVYEGGAWAWQQELQAATAPVREQAQHWVRTLGESPSLSIRDRRGQGPLLQEGGGTRLDTALKLAFSTYDPQVVFIVTDGEINSIPGGRITEETLVGLIRALQAAQAQPARIHVVHFKTAQMREVELQTLRAIARQGKGRFTEIVATER